MADMSPRKAATSTKKFEPFVPAATMMPEFTPKAIILGVIFGIIFGASTVYLALKAGLTVSASIPISVLSISVLRMFGRGTILENNIVQTIGSAGESIAAGVAFTIPALIFLSGGESYFTYFNIFTLALVGGILGVLFMVPLRRSLIVKEHGNLPYPEGTACADVLIAGEKGGSLAQKVFAGLGIAVLYKSLMTILGLWKETPAYSAARTAVYPQATVECNIVPEYLGVGYIIGPRIAGVLVAGGVLSYLVLMPLLAIVGDALQTVLKPGVGDKLISQMSPGELRVGYIRYIGAGAVAAGGLITLCKTLPTIISALKESFGNLRELKAGKSLSRTERDLPITFVIVGAIALMLIVSLLPQLPGTFPGSLFMGLLVVVFGFFFVTVSSRIVGIIGSSSNPISGMTIATLMATCLLFVSLGWTGDAYQAMALCVGGMVCIAAANAGNTSQDLKTGYLLGATPRYQQFGLIIGVLASVFAVGFTIQLMDASQRLQGITHAIGTTDYPAPQATLMATIIRGLLAQDLPWSLVFVGVFISIVVELCGISSLSFAVGVYLPLSTTMPIFIGGMLKGLVDRMSGHKGEESEISPGMLYATGLVAGGSLLGVLIAGLQGATKDAEAKLSYADWILNSVGVRGWEHLGATSDLIAVAMFGVLCFFLFRAGRQKFADPT
jgi:putative OPT family oligopeptide transporter